MAWWMYLGLFILSNIILYISGERLVRELVQLSRLLRVRHFIVAFFILAAAASIPNLLVGVHAAIQGTPTLSLGDIFGNNLVAMTVGVAAALIWAPGGVLPSGGRIVQTSALFTAVAAIAPLLLLLDGNLSRGDGLILIGLFAVYANWVFQTQKSQTEETKPRTPLLGQQFRILLNSLGLVVLSLALLLGAAYGIVISATHLAGLLGISLVVIGIVATGLGNALPEVYFAAISARRGETSFILGNLMGAVLIPATLILGLVALIHPIQLETFNPIISGRLILILAAIFFYLFARSGKVITRWEGLALLAIYVVFIAMTIMQTLN